MALNDAEQFVEQRLRMRYTNIPDGTLVGARRWSVLQNFVDNIVHNADRDHQASICTIHLRHRPPLIVSVDKFLIIVAVGHPDLFNIDIAKVLVNDTEAPGRQSILESSSQLSKERRVRFCGLAWHGRCRGHSCC